MNGHMAIGLVGAPELISEDCGMRLDVCLLFCRTLFEAAALKVNPPGSDDEIPSNSPLLLTLALVLIQFQLEEHEKHKYLLNFVYLQ